ncbi:LutC/YkgG family protein [Sinomicrobium sp. M5D2P17]
MNSKERILSSLRSVVGEPLPRPEIDLQYKTGTLVEEFVSVAEASGTEVFLATADTVTDTIENWSKGDNIQSSVPGFQEKYPLIFDEQFPFEKDKMPGVFITEASFGVAENAALWLTDTELNSRLLAFIPERIVVLLKADSLLPTMHQAYERIGENPPFGFGLFMAGASKTADIEQTLVKGAQGAKELAVILY